MQRFNGIPSSHLSSVIFCEPLLILCKQAPVIAASASRYLQASLPAFFLICIYECLRKFLIYHQYDSPRIHSITNLVSFNSILFVSQEYIIANNCFFVCNPDSNSFSLDFRSRIINAGTWGRCALRECVYGTCMICRCRNRPFFDVDRHVHHSIHIDVSKKRAVWMVRPFGRR